MAKKRVLAIIAAFSVMLFSAGCGNEEEEQTTVQNTTTQTTQTGAAVVDISEVLVEDMSVSVAKTEKPEKKDGIFAISKFSEEGSGYNINYSFSFEEDGSKLTMDYNTSQQGQGTTVVYFDECGNVIKMENTGGTISDYVYSGNTVKVTSSDTDGTVRQIATSYYNKDLAYLGVVVTDAEGNTLSTLQNEIDENGDAVKSIENSSNGIVVTSRSYDEHHRQLSMMIEKGSDVIYHQFIYDDNGELNYYAMQIDSTTDYALGYSVTSEKDADGRDKTIKYTNDEDGMTARLCEYEYQDVYYQHYVDMAKQFVG